MVHMKAYDVPMNPQSSSLISCFFLSFASSSSLLARSALAAAASCFAGM